MTAATCDVRHAMHESYKVVRADNPTQLHKDAATPVQGDDALLAQQAGRDRSLGAAVGAGLTRTTRAMLAAGADPNQSNTRHQSDVLPPIVIAASLGRLQIVSALLEHKADPNYCQQRSGVFPLMLAAQHGYVGVCRLLLEHGADPNFASSAMGVPALISAVQMMFVDVVEVLLSNGANVNQPETQTWSSALYNAAEKGSLELGKILLAHGANPNQAIGAMPTDTVMASPNRLPEMNDTGTTPLFIAVSKGRTAWVKLLLLSGADQRPRANRATPMMCARHGNCTEIIAMLTSHANGTFRDTYARQQTEADHTMRDTAREAPPQQHGGGGHVLSPADRETLARVLSTDPGGVCARGPAASADVWRVDV